MRNLKTNIDCDSNENGKYVLKNINDLKLYLKDILELNLCDACVEDELEIKSLNDETKLKVSLTVI